MGSCDEETSNSCETMCHRVGTVRAPIRYFREGYVLLPSLLAITSDLKLYIHLKITIINVLYDLNFDNKLTFRLKRWLLTLRFHQE